MSIQKNILEQLEKSEFRNSFKLNSKMKAYAIQKGRETIRLHAQDFIAHRLAPAFLENDGRQTPMNHHPVFIAQHATATCCRQCLYKWHKIPFDRDLNATEQAEIVNLIMSWIDKQMRS